MEAQLQFIAILITVAGLLGWLLKQIITFFINTSTQKDSYIKDIVEQNQKNTVSFVDTINHQRTMDREMQGKHLATMQELKTELAKTNEINEKIFNKFSI